MLKAVLWLLVSRYSNNVYVAYSNTAVSEVHTNGCTQSARLQRAYIEKSESNPKKQFLVFVDSDGEVEGDCEILFTKALKHGTTR